MDVDEAEARRAGEGRWRAGLRAVAINRAFGLFSLGALPSAMAGWMQNVALGWIVASGPNPAFGLGLLSFTSMGPLVLAPLGGTLADRVDRRLLLMGCACAQLAAALVLAVLALAGQLSMALVLALALANGLPNAVMWPTWSAFVADLVPARDLRRAVAVNSGRFNLTRVLGPAVAGALLARSGPALCLATAAICSSSLLVTLLFVRPRYTRPRPPAAPWLGALAEAARHAVVTPALRAPMLSAGTLGLLALPYAALLPGFVRGALHGNPQDLGLLVTAGGAGAVVGAVLSGTSLAAGRPRQVAAALHLLTGLSVATLGLSPTIGWACLAAALIGLASVAYLSVVNATLQINTPPAMIGRMLGLWVVVNSGTVPLGSLLLGSLASRYGLPAVETAAGLLSALGALFLILGRAAEATEEPALAPLERTATSAAPRHTTTC